MVQDLHLPWSGVDTKAAVLFEELTPRLSDSQRTRLTILLHDLAARPPPRVEDKRKVANEVNRILDIYRVRIDVGDGLSYRLVVKNPEYGRGKFYLRSTKGRGSETGLRSTGMLLIDVDTHYASNRYRHEPPGP